MSTHPVLKAELSIWFLVLAEVQYEWQIVVFTPLAGGTVRVDLTLNALPAVAVATRTHGIPVTQLSVSLLWQTAVDDERVEDASAVLS